MSAVRGLQSFRVHINYCGDIWLDFSVHDGSGSAADGHAAAGRWGFAYPSPLSVRTPKKLAMS